MNRPYVLVHMMTSIDGRIDCGMTAQLAGEPEYYSTLDSLNAPTRISGRVTAETELASGNKFISKNNEPINGVNGTSKRKVAVERRITST